jgi:DNA-binding PadR family transcriptional regulator
MAMRRLRRKVTTENLWLHILAALKDKPMYGYEIANYLKKNKGLDAAVITVYTVLYKMEREGLIARKTGDKIDLRKVYYETTPHGAAVLEEGVEFLQNLLNEIRGS